MSLIGRQPGETVYINCATSMGASSEGDVEIINVSKRFDELTGEKYDVIETNENLWDSRDGSCINNKNSMYYIT